MELIHCILVIIYTFKLYKRNIALQKVEQEKTIFFKNTYGRTTALYIVLAGTSPFYRFGVCTEENGSPRTTIRSQ